MFGFGKKKKPERPELPVVENECGKFTMGRVGFGNYSDEPDGVYYGTVEWCGHETEAYVECDTDVTADKGFIKLAELLANSEKLDNEIKDFAFNWVVKDGLVDDIIYWDKKKKCRIENPVPLTKEQFLENTELRFIRVNDNCSVEFSFALYSQVELCVYIDSDGKMGGEFFEDF